MAQIRVSFLFKKAIFEMPKLFYIHFAAYSFDTSMPVLSFILLISSRFESMWVPLGVGVAGFLSGMALANSDMDILMAHPFAVMLKPAYAFYCQILCAGVFPAHGNGCIPCSICYSRATRHAHDGDYGNIACPLFIEMVCWIISYHAALCDIDVWPGICPGSHTIWQKRDEVEIVKTVYRC